MLLMQRPPILFSSNTDEWRTPRWFFAKLNRRFHFTLDAAATKENATCARYFSKKDDGLKQDWKKHRVFLNPPYCRQISRWLIKAFDASQRGALVVVLLPGRISSRWFHNHVLGKARIEFIRGRLKFGKADNGAPFDSLLAIYEPKPAKFCIVCGDGFRARSDAKTCSDRCRQALRRSRL
jgi:site-specific DNA-methyltransferase (adenine-specific)